MLRFTSKKLYIKLLFSLILLINLTSSHAYLREAETTRTMALGGAGIASLLLNESAVLNPSSIAFFAQSTFYYQKSSSTLDEKAPQRLSEFKDGESELALLTDTSSGLKGGVSYQRIREDDEKRIRYTASLAATVGKKSSFGIIYRYTDEDSDLIQDEYHQGILGLTHIYSEKLILAATVVDPNQRIKEQFKYTIGAQYSFTSSIIALLDIGSGDVANPNDESFTKAAIQLQSFKRLYLRYAKFNDLHENISGFAWGVSWVGPKFSLDYAYKNSEVIENRADKLYSDEKIIENSFSLTVLF